MKMLFHILYFYICSISFDFLIMEKIMIILDNISQYLYTNLYYPNYRLDIMIIDQTINHFLPTTF